MASDHRFEQKAYGENGQLSLFSSLSVGAGAGFFGWLLFLALDNWIVRAVFCRSADSVGVCANAESLSWAIAIVLVGLASLFVLVRANVFRPLLVVLAAIVALWMVGVWFVPLVWWIGLIWHTLLFALAYALFAWVVSTENFVYALIVTIVLVVGLRLVVIL